MADLTLLEEILGINSAFISGKAKILNPEGEIFMVVACMDPRLTGMLEQALGLPQKRALVVRTAGNRITRENHDTLRSVAAGVYLKQVSEVFIVGHTDCGMAQFSAADVIQRFRAAGVPRSAFGHEDLRTWFGAIPDVKANVLESAEFLRSSGLFGPSIKVHGLLIDSQTGVVELISDGYQATVSVSVERAFEKDREEVEARAAVKAAPPEMPPPLRSPRHEAREMEHRGGRAGLEPGEAAGEDVIAQTLSVVDFLFRQAKTSPELGKMLPRITDALHHEKNPVRIINLIERSIRDFGVLNPEAFERFEHVKKVVRSRPEASAALMELVKKLAK